MLYIIRGMPGSGKTTLGKGLEQDNQATLIEADDFFTDPSTGKYVFESRMVRAAHKMARRQMMRYVYHKRPVACAAIFATRREIMSYIDAARAVDSKVMAAIITCLDSFESTHEIPDDVIARHAKNFVSSRYLSEFFWSNRTAVLDYKGGRYYDV